MYIQNVHYLKLINTKRLITRLLGNINLIQIYISYYSDLY